jgi:hypothetical protein
MGGIHFMRRIDVINCNRQGRDPLQCPLQMLIHSLLEGRSRFNEYLCWYASTNEHASTAYKIFVFLIYFVLKLSERESVSIREARCKCSFSMKASN